MGYDATNIASSPSSGTSQTLQTSSHNLLILQGGTGGEERAMPPGPGSVVNAAIDIYAGDSNWTLDAAVVVIRKARHHPLRPWSRGWQ